MALNFRALYSLLLAALINSKRNDVSSFLFVIASPQHTGNSKVNLSTCSRILPSVPPGGSFSVQRSNTTAHNDTSSSFYNTVTFDNESEKDDLTTAGTTTSSSILRTLPSVHSSENLSTKVNICPLFRFTLQRTVPTRV